MKNFNKMPNRADQSEVRSAIDQKREVNLQKNSTLYFQIGLILCLLGVYGLFEMNFTTKLYAIEKVKMQPYDDFVIEQWRPEKKVEVEEKQDTKEKVVFKGQDPEVVDDDTPEEIVTDLLNPDQTDPVEVIDPSEISDPNDDFDDIDETFSIIGVEKVPIYPGCEKAKNNDERRKCMSDKLSKLIQKKFNSDIAQGYGLSGVQKIDV